MKRVLLKIAYDGTRYAGFARQPGQETIEGVLDETISSLTGESIEVIGASRTDAGVHARANIAVFDTESPIPPEKFSYALNRRLPPRIRIQESYEVAPDFHPRHCSTVKTYEYHIYNAEFEDPIRRMYSFHTYYPLNTEAMQEAGQYLTGEHDFRSFCGNPKMNKSTVRTIYTIRIDETEDEIDIGFVGDGFLQYMVRILVGTLIEVGEGKRDAQSMNALFEARSRRMAGPTAPAQGLTLMEVRYS